MLEIEHAPGPTAYFVQVASAMRAVSSLCTSPIACIGQNVSEKRDLGLECKVLGYSSRVYSNSKHREFQVQMRKWRR